MITAGDGLDLYEDLLVENSGEGEGHFRAEAEEVPVLVGVLCANLRSLPQTTLLHSSEHSSKQSVQKFSSCSKLWKQHKQRYSGSAQMHNYTTA